MKHILFKFFIPTQQIQIDCVAEPNIFAFGISPIKVIASIGKHSDRTTDYEDVLGCISTEAQMPVEKKMYSLYW